MPHTPLATYKPSFSSNRAVQFLLAFLFLINIGGALFGPILAIYIEEMISGATLSTIGFAVAISAVVKSILQVPLSQYTDRHKGEVDDFVMMLSGALLTTLYVFGFLLIRTAGQFYALSALGGVSAACVFAAYYGIFSRHVDGGNEGFEWSLFSIVGVTVPIAIGGAFGGVVADIYGFMTLFLLGGVLSSIATVVLIFLYPYLYRAGKQPSR